MNNYIELSSKNKVTGRRKIKAVIHEIYENDSEYNKNGISWNEKYTKHNLDTVEGMPICVEFLDYEKSEPFGHGDTGIKDGRPLFEDSVMVGIFEQGNIENIKVKDKKIKALVGTGYINEQRYPLFVRWLISKMHDKNSPEGSVEICAKDGQDAIIYDGGWKEKGRIPEIYDYTGYCILGIEPADDSAVILELNNKFKNKKEENPMSEKIITELNEKIETKTNEINELKNDVKEKENKIKELNSKLEKKEKEINELKKDKEKVDKEKKDVEGELKEVKAEKKKLDDKNLIGELSEKLEAYAEEEKEIVKDKIEKFEKEPSKELLGEIIGEINNAIAQKVLEGRNNQEKKKVESEKNSKVEDIYGDIYETNSDDEITIDDLF